MIRRGTILKVRLALIGCDISHSRSPELYQEFIHSNIHYDLIDCKKGEEIPSLVELAQNYQGINITAPYKTHFLNQVEIHPACLFKTAINTIDLQNGFVATNTDFLAIKEILQTSLLPIGFDQIYLLGSGSMAQMTKLILGDKATQVSRSQGKSPAQFSCSKENTLVINACSKAMRFSGKLAKNSVFWDFNYEDPKQQEYLESLSVKYIDGLELLRIQALHAAKFWGFVN